MRLYVFRARDGWMVATTWRARYLMGFGRFVSFRRTHAEAFADAWARTHPKEET